MIWRYFYPVWLVPRLHEAGYRACPYARAYLVNSCDTAPHFYGAFGDYYYVNPGAAIFKVPDELSDQMVAGINCALAQVVGGMQLAQLKLGENVVIQGAGGLGVYATAVAKEMGAGKVIVIDGVKSSGWSWRAAFGADEVIDFEQLPDADQRVQRVLELTDGWGADVVAELVGHPRVCNEGLRMVGRAGRYLEIGNISPGLTYTLDPQCWSSATARSSGCVYYEAEHLQQALDLVRRTRDKYPWDRVLSHTFPLEQINEAFEASDRGEVTRAAITLRTRDPANLAAC